MRKINKSGFCKDENLKQVCCACSTFGCVFLMKKNDLCLVQLPPVVLFSKQHHSIQKRARVVTSYIQICTPKQSVFSRRQLETEQNLFRKVTEDQSSKKSHIILLLLIFDILFLFASFLMHKAFVYVLSLSSMLSSAPLNRQRIKRTCSSAVYFFFHVKFIKKNIVETRLKPRKSIITLF